MNMQTTTTRTALILGANGRFGAAAARAFAAAGWVVLAQARRPGAATFPGIRPLPVPLADVDALVAAAAGATAVVHAINPVYTRWDTEVLPLARMGMEAARRLGARFMLPGNVYNFGEAMPAKLSEDTAQMPTTSKGRIRCDLERELEDRAADGLRSVVIRAGDFFGAGTGSWFDLAVVKSLAQGKLVYPGPLDVPHAWAYLPDLARSFVAVAEHDALPDFARLHFAGYTLTGSELLAAIERAATTLGIAPAGGFRHGSMPWGLIRVGGLVVPLWRALAEMSYLWRVPHALDGTAMERLLGPTRATDLDIALRESLVALGLSRPASKPAATALI